MSVRCHEVAGYTKSDSNLPNLLNLPLLGSAQVSSLRGSDALLQLAGLLGEVVAVAAGEVGG